MTKRRSVMDRLRSAWENNPGTVAEVAEKFVPEANRREIEEVDRGSRFGGGSYAARDVAIINRGKAKAGEPKPIPNGQRRVIRKYDPFGG